MVDVFNEFRLSEEFAACNSDTFEANEFLNAFNNGEAFFAGINNEALYYEHELNGVILVPLDEVARMYSEGPELFEKFLQEQPQAKDFLDEAVKNLPECESQVIGQMLNHTVQFS